MIHNPSHVPVLLKETIDILRPAPGEFFIDGTLGGGGHAREILKRIEPTGTFLGVDWNSKALENFKKEIGGSKENLFLEHANFVQIPEILSEKKMGKADGILLDLGFSSDDLENVPGLSFSRNEALDMRYGDELKERYTAAEFVNSLSVPELERVFREYGEERYALKIAKAIFDERKKKRILTTGDLVTVVGHALQGRRYEGGRINQATRVFLALRILVNRELDNLKDFLEGLTGILKPAGKAAIISFQSLEDRI